MSIRDAKINSNYFTDNVFAYRLHRGQNSNSMSDTPRP